MTNNPNGSKLRTNYVRRGVGVVICFAPFGLPITSLSLGPPSSELAAKLFAITTIPGLVCTLLGLLVALMNAHLAFLRPYLYRRRHGSLDGMRNVSILPGIGTVAVIVGCWFAFGYWPTAVIGLLVLATDVGGFPWFLVQTWRDSGFWDE
jgi:hypothetical protein